MIKKRGLLRVFILGLLLLVVACSPTSQIPSESDIVIVPPQKVAVIVPVVDDIPNVPEVIFIGISAVDPLDFATRQSIRLNLVVTFDEAMDLASINEDTFILRGPNGADLPGVITADSTNKIFTFNPEVYLDLNVLYNVMITTDAKGVSGNSLIRNFAWSFTTGQASNTGGGGGSSTSTTTAPVVESGVLTTITSSPETATLAIGDTEQIVATSLDQFESPIAVTINYTSSNPLIATVNSSGFVTAIAAGTATITSSSGSINDTSIITVVSAGAECPAVAVNLGTASNFAILAKSGISTTGTTSIIGDIGVSPAAASFITGFALVLDASTTFSTSSLVTGSVYAADYSPPTPAMMSTAVSDMEAAYVNAAGLADCVTELGAGEIGGMTLAAGSYKWGTGLLISTDVTLTGNATDVWVFEVAGTLGLANAKQVILTGGALAKNVHWVVGGVTTLGTTSVMNGNILSAPGVAVDEAIVLNTGATLNGRALSQKAVTLDANTVTKPSN